MTELTLIERLEAVKADGFDWNWKDEDAPKDLLSEYTTTINEAISALRQREWVKAEDMEQTKEFHQKFDVPILSNPCIPKDRVRLRQDILEEEVEELWEAIKSNDIAGVLDALTDIKYVVNGTALEFGLGDVFKAAYDEVHASNMSKLGKDGKPFLREDGKVLKGPDYFKPRWDRVLPPPQPPEQSS